jgi:hypothetical protein
MILKLNNKLIHIVNEKLDIASCERYPLLN